MKRTRPDSEVHEYPVVTRLRQDGERIQIVQSFWDWVRPVLEGSDGAKETRLIGEETVNWCDVRGTNARELADRLDTWYAGEFGSRREITAFILSEEYAFAFASLLEEPLFRLYRLRGTFDGISPDGRRIVPFPLSRDAWPFFDRWDDLPCELFAAVFEYLTWAELLRAAEVCIRWKDASRDDSISLWRDVRASKGFSKGRDHKESPWTWVAEVHCFPDAILSSSTWWQWMISSPNSIYIREAFASLLSSPSSIMVYTKGTVVNSKGKTVVGSHTALVCGLKFDSMAYTVYAITTFLEKATIRLLETCHLSYVGPISLSGERLITKATATAVAGISSVRLRASHSKLHTFSHVAR